MSGNEDLVGAHEIQAEVRGTAVLVLSQFVEPAYAMRLIETYPGGKDDLSYFGAKYESCRLPVYLANMFQTLRLARRRSKLPQTRRDPTTTTLARRLARTASAVGLKTRSRQIHGTQWTLQYRGEPSLEGLQRITEPFGGTATREDTSAEPLRLGKQ